jgi:hypothetical protein
VNISEEASLAVHRLSGIKSFGDSVSIVQEAINSATAKLQEKNKALRECAEGLANVLGMLEYTSYDTVETWPNRHVTDKALATFHKLKGSSNV